MLGFRQTVSLEIYVEIMYMYFTLFIVKINHFRLEPFSGSE